ncbi:McrB family protein [Modestobacter sp. VKM Ac-2984]|uniref:McrB family protein n=1 Tax=Modestobacter sp. VKM Ac-2984 TaxID=3004138 RepID=UPI0022AA258D|nr:AAA family ATPase [Modestobacter sp. VKM Ac-2984]MCZ2817909.1 AAA family ATPase [Modestobacter sp. VKM Ac-2984]
MDSGLGADDSTFTPGAAIWTAESLEDLYERFVLAPDTGGRRFLEKLEDQLKGAPAATVQLTAELLYLHLLAPADMGGVAKRNLLTGTLAIGAESVTIPADLSTALDRGFARVGTAYLTQRDRQLSFLVRFARAWKQLPDDARTEALADPWAFHEVVNSVPINSAYSQRNALLHLGFPDTFEPIVSRQHKAKILAAFADELPERTDNEDRDLHMLRGILEAEHGGPISFYESPTIAQRWRGQSPVGEGADVRGWLVRGANVNGHNVVPDWLAGGYCSIAYTEFSEPPSGRTRSQLDSALADAIPELSARQRAVHVGILDRFLNQMHPGDVVATVDGPRLYVGTVTGPAEWQNGTDTLSSHRRAVDWVAAEPVLQRSQLSDAARDKLSGQMTVSDLRPFAAEYARLAGLDDSEPATEESGEATAPELTTPVSLPGPTKQLAEQLLVDLAWLEETLELLREKNQIVLYGPPGTGKTYLAQEIAEFIAEQTGGGFRLVQLHPSYAYEDFFEGFRPQPGATAGTISFELEPGPFKLLVDEARDNLSHGYVLVIDEINRANLAKVFGELYFLLEYRDRSISLQYSPQEEFSLPPNVFVIGTMNTADRSIALVDAAMRRRFAWQGLFPSDSPVSGLLRAWLRREGLPEDRADLLDALNHRIGDRDAMVGPSYLMSRTVGTDAGLSRIWKHQILPLLEERHVGEGIDVPKRYGIQALREATAPTTSEQPPE